MKSLRFLVAACASLVGMSAFGAHSYYGRQWLEHYYQNPRPDDLITAVKDLDAHGYLDVATQRETALGVLTEVCRRNQSDVDGWVNTSRRVMSDRAARLVAAAAWLSGNQQARFHVERLSVDEDFGLEAQIALAMNEGTPSSLEAVAINSQPLLNAEWGAFLATGDARYVHNVFVALGSDQPGLANSARFDLAQRAATDPRVMQICQNELSRSPQSVRESFEAALNETHTTPRPGA